MTSNPGPARRILVAHTGGGLGDLLVSSPVAEALVQLYPGVSVTVWADERFAPILRGHPSIAQVWTAALDRPFRDLLRTIREAHYDLAVFPWALGRQAWLAALARIPRRVGAARRTAYSFLFTDRVVVRTERGDVTSHWADVQLDYVRALGWRGATIEPRIRLTAEEAIAARADLAARGVASSETLCVLHIGKGLPVDGIRWPIGRFVDIGRRLVSEHGLRVLLTGRSRERGLTAEVARAIGAGALDMAGTTPDVRHLCSVIAQSALFVGIDSGPMHLAAALGVPTVGIFPLRSDCPPRWRPRARRSAVVRTGDWQCPLTCVKEACRDFVCLSHIDVEEAVRAASGLLSARRVGLTTPCRSATSAGLAQTASGSRDTAESRA